MEQDVFVSHTHQGKLHFRGRHFSNSFIFAGLLLWEIESKESSASMQMGQVRAGCHLSFDQAAKALGSVISPPGTGKVCDIPMSRASVEEHDTQENYHCTTCCTSTFSGIFPSNPVRWILVLCPFDIKGRGLKNVWSKLGRDGNKTRTHAFPTPELIIDYTPGDVFTLRRRGTFFISSAFLMTSQLTPKNF